MRGKLLQSLTIHALVPRSPSARLSQRHFHCSRPSMTSTTTAAATHLPNFSAGSDAAALTSSLQLLLRTGGTGRWALTGNGRGVERGFKFKTFKKTWEFMNAVAKECALQKHHPEWSNIYNTAFIRWTTHSPPGLSHKDLHMARFCDQQAAACGEEQEQEQGQATDAFAAQRELADRAALEGADCCVPASGSGSGSGLGSSGTRV